MLNYKNKKISDISIGPKALFCFSFTIDKPGYVIRSAVLIS